MTKNRPYDSPLTLPSRISDVVKPWAESAPDSLALIEASGAWTYRQLASAISTTQAWLRKSGVRPGDRFMIVGENCREFVALLLASASMDAWPVLVNARVSPREIDEIQDHCDARRVLFCTSVSPNAADHATRHGASFESVEGLGSIGIGALKENAKAEPIDVNDNVADRVAALIYTSGTTGLPKGVMLSHRNLLFLAAGSAKIPLPGAVRPPVRHPSDVSCGGPLRCAPGIVAQRRIPLSVAPFRSHECPGYAGERADHGVARRAGNIYPIPAICKVARS